TCGLRSAPSPGGHNLRIRPDVGLDVGRLGRRVGLGVQQRYRVTLLLARVRRGRPEQSATPVHLRPLLMAAGTRDDRTTMAETIAMFARAPQPKLLWTVDSAGHVDLEGFAPRGLSRERAGVPGRLAAAEIAVPSMQPRWLWSHRRR